LTCDISGGKKKKGGVAYPYGLALKRLWGGGKEKNTFPQRKGEKKRNFISPRLQQKKVSEGSWEWERGT